MEDQPDRPSRVSDEKAYWLDDPRNVRKVYLGLWLLCVGLLVADFLYQKHVHFALEGHFGIFGIFGFLSYVFIILAAKQLRKILRREEDYYDR
ncbi:MAG: hypothetical protein ACE5HV_07365 [Acidobacteriota bacterium]